MGAAFHHAGYRAAVIDMDRQGSAFLWSNSGDENLRYPVEVHNFAPLKSPPLMIRKVGDLSNDYDIILIDCPPAMESSVPWAALTISDIGLIPVIPAAVEIWAAKEAKDVGFVALKENESLQLFTLASMVRRSAVISSYIKVLEKDLEFPMLKTVMTMRNDYLKSQAYGVSVLEISAKSPASLEVKALAHELLAKLSMKEVA